MRLYGGRIPLISEEILQALLSNEDIEVMDEEREEARMDVEACLKEFLRTDKDLSDQARELINQRGLDQSAFGKTKRHLAEQMGFGLGEDSVGWIANQILDMLMHSVHVEEIFAEDHEMRSRIAKVLRKHMAEDEELDQEVRRKIKNMEEGSTGWDVEYQRVMSQLKRTKKLL